MRRSTSFSRFSLAALLVAMAFNLNSGCGASDADKDKALEEQAAQLNNCSDRLRMGNEKIVSMQTQLTQCKADNTALQSKLDMGLCAPMLPIADGEVICTKMGSDTQIGTFKVRADATAQKGECMMGLNVPGANNVMTCKAAPRASLKFMCNDWVCEVR